MIWNINEYAEAFAFVIMAQEFVALSEEAEASAIGLSEPGKRDIRIRGEDEQNKKFSEA